MQNFKQKLAHLKDKFNSLSKTKKILIIAVPTIFLLAGISLIGILVFISINQNRKQSPEVVTEEIDYTKYLGSTMLSRRWMEYAMDIVRAEKPAPTEAARFYAYVSKAYYLASSNDAKPEVTNYIEASVINQIYPKFKNRTNKFVEVLNKDNDKNYIITNDISIQPESLDREFNALLNREKSDGYYDLKWDSVIPTGLGKWLKGAKDPFTPSAGEWQRWLVDTNYDFKVPEPPQYDSPQDKAEIQKVKDAVLKRDAEWIQKINFWGGTPGTETPSGIWLNRLYTETKDGVTMDDKKYAYIQSTLAQSIADSFMECWKVKFTYWTARPSMRIPELKTAMPDPVFPSYLSGHSTISRTAAEVLGALVPEKKAIWLKNAEEARDSRLYAGIHFDIDNQEGFKLGEKVGKLILAKLNLASVYSSDQKTSEISFDTDNFADTFSGNLKPRVLDKSEESNARGNTNGYLYNLTKSGFKNFLISTTNANFKPGLGSQWALTKVTNPDPMWAPGACSSISSEIYGDNFIAMFDPVVLPTGLTNFKLVVYNFKTKKFNYLLEVAKDSKVADDIFTESISKKDENTLVYYYIPSNYLIFKTSTYDENSYVRTNPNPKFPFIMRRELNLTTFAYTDTKIKYDNSPISNYPQLYININKVNDKNKYVAFYYSKNNYETGSDFRLGVLDDVGKKITMTNQINSDGLYDQIREEEFKTRYRFKVDEMNPASYAYPASYPQAFRLIDPQGKALYTMTLPQDEGVGALNEKLSNMLYVSRYVFEPGASVFNVGFFDLNAKKFEYAINSTNKDDYSTRFFLLGTY